MNTFNISCGSLTNVGNRTLNEDCLDILVGKTRIAFVLCDGLGGHGAGNVASGLVVRKMKEELSRGSSIQESIIKAQNTLINKQIEMDARDAMKTTVTCLTISDNIAQWGHVGDSRIYLFEKAKYKMRTMDHSVPQMLVNRGDIKESAIRHHEDRNRLLRVMGTNWDSPKCQIIEGISITKNTSFLLCSDGFWELIDEKMMCKTLRKAKTPQDWLNAMEIIVRENGKGTNMDNYSAIAVFVRE